MKNLVRSDSKDNNLIFLNSRFMKVDFIALRKMFNYKYSARSAARWSLPVTQKALYTVDIVVPSPRFAASKTRKRIYLITANEVEVWKY